MKFLLLIISDEKAWAALPRPEQERVVARHGEFEQALVAEGKFLSCNALRPSSEARTVHIRGDGSRVVTDGPYAETRELVGGYYLIECPSTAEAVEWAKRLPNVFGSVEVRPVEDMP
jgi:hypothetical protein